MICPYCGADDNFVAHSDDMGERFRRTRKCRNCKKTFRTWEEVRIEKKMVCCKWCGREITNWGYKYDGMWFCDGGTKTRAVDGICLKNYLFEKYQKDIEHDVVITEEDLKLEAMRQRKDW